MINFDEYKNDHKKERNFNWPYIPITHIEY